LNEDRKYQTQTDWAVQVLRDAILKGEIKPGEKLRQENLAQQLGISPTPIREAFRRLEVEGLLVHSAHKGVRVVEFTVKDAEEVCLIRSALEGLAARLAVTNIEAEDLENLVEKLEKLQDEMDECLQNGLHERLAKLHDEFHMSIYTFAHSQRLLQLITFFRSNYPQDTLWVIPGRAEESMDEHRMILEAVRKGDGELTEKLVRQHLECAMVALLDHLDNSEPDSFLLGDVKDSEIMRGGEG
jgi:DNA-binding GntR family transcriptional regulator